MGAPVLIPFMASVLSWLLRDVVVKFFVFVGVFSLVAVFAPRAVSYLGNFISPGVFTSAFASIDPGVWYVLRFFVWITVCR